MSTNKIELIKGNYYSINEIEAFGSIYSKETSKLLFYRKDNNLYIIDSNPDENGNYKIISILKD